MADVNYDVIVVGAGPGGSSCGALLAKRGLKVLIVDKNPQPGGKHMTLTRDGFRCETFPVIGVPSGGSAFSKVLKELGMEKEVELMMPDPFSKIYYKPPSGEMRHVIIPGGGRHIEHQKIFDFLGITEAEAPECFRFFGEMATMSPHDIDLLDDVSWHEFLCRYQIPRSLYAYMASLQGEGVLVAPVDIQCASEFVKFFQECLRGGGGLYPRGGYGRTFEAFADSVGRNGGEVLLNTRVEKISVKKGGAAGVVTEKGEFSAPVVVSSAGIQPTVLKLVGEKYFDASYVNYVRDLIPSWSFLGVRCILNQPVIEYPVYMYFTDAVSTLDTLWRAEALGEMPDEVYIYLETNSLFPGMAPEGKQLVFVGTTGPANPKANMKPWQDKLEETLGEVWPEVLENAETVEQFGPGDVPAVSKDAVLPGQGGECIGIAQIVGQCGKYKSSPKSPIRGLFYVGADAGGRGLGTNQAVDSGINVADMVLKYYQTHHRGRRD